MSEHTLFEYDYVEFTFTARPVLPWWLRWMKVSSITKVARVSVLDSSGAVRVSVSPDETVAEEGGVA